VTKLHKSYPFLAASHARRLVRRYGTKASVLLGSAQKIEDLGRLFGSDLYEAEVLYLMQHEWARTTNDILWRRSKKGLHLSHSEVSLLDHFISEVVQRQVAAQ
jgi:glycerol-3-phosphate dehydrogenase